MSKSETSPRVRQAEEFVREHMSRDRPSSPRPYEVHGSHVILGQEKPLARSNTQNVTTVPVKKG
jgi:hypothetical protein